MTHPRLKYLVFYQRPWSRTEHWRESALMSVLMKRARHGPSSVRPLPYRWNLQCFPCIWYILSSRTDFFLEVSSYAEIFGNIMQQNVLITQKKFSIMRNNGNMKIEQLVKRHWPLGPSVLARILPLCSQSKHHFCQDNLNVWSFSAIRQVFVHLSHFFPLNFTWKTKY